jgi:hypothetical protein
MADPFSILAIGTLAYFGHKFSKNEQYKKLEIQEEEKPVLKLNNLVRPKIDEEPFLRAGKSEIQPFTDLAPQQRTNGNEILDM